MTYEYPELVLVGSAAAVVLGELGGSGDNVGDPTIEHVQEGFALGLDE